MQEDNYLLKRWLGRVNQRFRLKEKQKEFVIDPQNHKIDMKNGIVKNFMRLTNKTLIGINQIKVNKAAIFSGVFGLLVGHLCSQIDESLTNIIHSYRSKIRDLLIKQVLQSAMIKNKLNEALLENVYTNPEIQYKLSQVLVDEAINPQLNDLFILSKRGIIEALQSQDVKQLGIKAAVQGLRQNGDVIGDLALQFLGGPFMARILREKVSDLLSQEQTCQVVSAELKKVLKKDLNSQERQEKLYSVIRQKFVNW